MRAESCVTAINRDPSFPMYARDYLCDERVMGLTLEQQGARIRLLCYAWIADPVGTLPDDDVMLARLSGLDDRWTTVGERVKALFTRTAEGRLLDVGLHAVHVEREEYRKKKAAAGKKGGRPKGTKQRDNTAKARRKQTRSTEPNENNQSGRRRHAHQKPSSSSSLSSSSSRALSPASDFVNAVAAAESSDNGGAPLWTERMFQYRADKIPVWVKQVMEREKVCPGDPDFDALMEAAWGFTWERWIELRDRHAKHYSRTAPPKEVAH